LINISSKINPRLQMFLV